MAHFSDHVSTGPEVSQPCGGSRMIAAARSCGGDLVKISFRRIAPVTVDVSQYACKFWCAPIWKSLPPVVETTIVPIPEVWLAGPDRVWINLGLASLVEVRRSHMQGLMDVPDQVGDHPKGLLPRAWERGSSMGWPRECADCIPDDLDDIVGLRSGRARDVLGLADRDIRIMVSVVVRIVPNVILLVRRQLAMTHTHALGTVHKDRPLRQRGPQKLGNPVACRRVILKNKVGDCTDGPMTFVSPRVRPAAPRQRDENGQKSRCPEASHLSSRR